MRLPRTKLAAAARLAAGALLAAGLAGLLAAAAKSPPGPQVVLLSIEGAVSPATADYAARGIRSAAERGAALVVLRLDTPGGLDTSMRRLIKEILASPVPVATFVAPSGARAASAGTFILYASHIAAMAPATNLGAATPVPIGIAPGGQPQEPAGGKDAAKDRDKDKAKAKGRAKEEEAAPKDSMSRKTVHDAAAYIRSLAQLRGRNAEWAERAVREAVSLSAEEAKKIKVIDLVAQDVPDLLKQLHGRKVTVQGVERALETRDAALVALEPDWRSRLLAVIAEPSVALILMMIGIYGLLFEFSNPGFVLPGVVGGICLLLALYAFQLLPVNYVGLGLILLGLAFIVAEAFLPSFGVLGIGGVVALLIGSVILFDPEAAGDYRLPTAFVVAFTTLSGAAVFLIVTLALRARRRPVVSGAEEMVGSRGEVLEDFEAEGWARVHSERWRVVAPRPMRRGERVRVTGVSGLTLRVEPDEETSEGRKS
ncbi:MAG TPA: nodulation protein NfeD [Burkholderiales bacterium]|nr:nodulation protein NfeD [Burkholderiales bacterium]